MAKKSYVVYTVLTDGYDNVLQPLVLDERFDYVLFSNDFKEEKVIGIWNICRIPSTVVSENDHKRLSRYPKSHPESMLSQYTASLYLDANIQIADKWVYDRFVELAENGVEYAGVKLVATGRDDIYQHAYDMCARQLEHDMSAIRQCHELYKRGFPEHFGLNENNIIFRLHTDLMKTVDEEWWWWIKNYSFRDQFSYMYCLWKYNIKREYFLPDGLDARNNKYFVYTPHDKNTFLNKKLVRFGFFERIRNSCRYRNQHLYDLYCTHWVQLCKMPFPCFFLFLWGLFVGGWNAFPILIKKLSYNRNNR